MSDLLPEPDDEGGRGDPTSRGAMYERVVNMDRLVKRMAVLINEMHPEVHELKQENEKLRAMVAQQAQITQTLVTTVGVLQARTHGTGPTTTGR